jgi:hypothetical protein
MNSRANSSPVWIEKLRTGLTVPVAGYSGTGELVDVELEDPCTVP